MGIEDKDFIIRQVKQVARGLGMLLSKNSLKEFISYEQTEADLLRDDELEAIILLADVEAKVKKEKLSEQAAAEKFEMSVAEWESLLHGSRLPTSKEKQALIAFLV
ncbi:hypothetical protein [Enterococcus sp. CSURQ0835]|uniref:hypothetical protein n=1 Tax=Enterococcus sp. CSURQ0835 TaxID=2681394 RepID=UPI00135AF121|nr:hypothetical protein [Enterococcus sp. CSURQ0835]